MGFIALVGSFQNCFASDTLRYWKVDTDNSFNAPHVPYADALSMWMLKQNFTLNAYQGLLKNQFALNSFGDPATARLHLEAYLPIFNTGSFSGLLGSSYNKSYILAENDSLSIQLQDVCQFWFALQYRYKNWRFTSVYEQFLRGDKHSLYSETGNTIRYFATACYAFSRRWQLMVFGAYIGTRMEDERQEMLIPAFELRFEPSRDLKMVAGAPLVFGLEWCINRKFDIFLSQVMLDDTQFHVLYHLNSHLNLSLHYDILSHSTSDTYFQGRQVLLEDAVYDFNKLKQQQHTVSVKLGILSFDDIGLILTGGYNIRSKVELHHNSDKLCRAEGKDEFFVGFSLQYLSYFD